MAVFSKAAEPKKSKKSSPKMLHLLEVPTKRQKTESLNNSGQTIMETSTAMETEIEVFTESEAPLKKRNAKAQKKTER